MATTIREILDKNLFSKATLVAGKKSIDNIITWVNVMEILDTPDTVKKGELLITTGYELFDKDKHNGLINKLKNHGVSGMIIQPGYYIDKIPQYIIDDANQISFPIIEIPSHFSFSEILHLLINEITQKNNYFNQEFARFNGIFSSINSKSGELFSYQDTEEHCFYLFCLSARDQYSQTSSKLITCTDKLRAFLSSQSIRYEYESDCGAVSAFLLELDNKKDLTALIYDFQIQLTFLSEQEGINYYAGADKVISSNYLHIAFEHSLKCISLLNDIAAKRGICAYENYTFIKMFGLLYQNNRSFVLDNKALQILLNHDRVNQTNYVHTVRAYLAENCNASRTAQRLYIHRHTLMNRITAITELCDLNFNDYYTRIYMSLALLIHDYYAI